MKCNSGNILNEASLFGTFIRSVSRLVSLSVRPETSPSVVLDFVFSLCHTAVLFQEACMLDA